MEMLVLVHLAATLVMVGVIWFVQLVHYPLMSEIPGSRFVDYQRQHMRRTGWVVIPPMLLEAGSAAALLVAGPPTFPTDVAVGGVVLLAVIWLSTFSVQVPAHRRLATGFDPAVHRRLVVTNWLRTGAWTGRAALVLSAGLG